MALDLTIGIAGSGGDGVILLGELLARSAARAGLHATLVKTFGPQIRGGETSARVRVADQPLSGADHRLDALLLFHFGDMLPFGSELPISASTQVFVDSIDDTPLEDIVLPEDVKGSAIRIPLEELALRTVRNKQSKNMVLAGVVLEYYGWPLETVEAVLAQRFARHGESVVASNRLAIEAGRQWVKENLVMVGPDSVPAKKDGGHGDQPHRTLQAVSLQTGEQSNPMYFLSGNEAFSLGALHAGCRFMAGYPISPASEILEWMTRQLPRFGGQCVQAEDEIAAVCLAIGASYGGARVLTATSGPGFSLKQEAIGLAHMAEIPLVVCNVQRCGPSTGIPTRTEQADLAIALHGGHGDNPRVVLAACTVADCYELAHAAFEIAEKYQTPVIVLLDQLISQSQQTVGELRLRVEEGGMGALARGNSSEPEVGSQKSEANEGDSVPSSATGEGARATDPLRRYAITASGVSPRTVPGMPGGEYVAVGIEHDEMSDPTSSQVMHQAQTAKRFRKLEGAAQEYPLVRTSGAERAQLGLLTWGSTYGVCAEAARLLSENGLPTSVLAPQLLYPLPLPEINAWLNGLGQSIVVELNYSGQFFHHLRGYVDLPSGTLQLNRAGGTPISLSELLQFLEDNVNLPAAFNHERLGAVLAGRLE